ncbi:MAG: DEAD/DEAH box helicase [Cetobacterium sp.]
MIFTKEQLEIIQAINNKQNVFITGPGGTGKSTIIKYLANETTLGRRIGITAMTGAAAVLINGQTLHSYLGIGLGKDSVDDLVRKIINRSKIKKNWDDLDILVVDEISMLSDELFIKLNEVAKQLRSNEKPFGGIQLVFAGDFLQLPCIKGNFCFECDDWLDCSFTTFHLTKILRQHDVRFQECLNNARYGRMTLEDIEYCTMNHHRSWPSKTGLQPDDSLRKESRIKPTRILCHNDDVNEINERKLKKLNATEIKKYDFDIEYNPIFYDPRKHQFIFQDITKICNAQPTICLAVGAQVMLLINIDTKNGLVNGSRGVVLEFTNNELPVVLFKNGSKLVIDFHKYEVTEGKKLIGTIFQIPLKLAYAITVHKSQGMTIDSAIIDLNGVFEYGQAYVALSRVKDVNSLYLYNALKSSFKAHPKAVNFYEKHVLNY